MMMDIYKHNETDKNTILTFKEQRNVHGLVTTTKKKHYQHQDTLLLPDFFEQMIQDSLANKNF